MNLSSLFGARRRPASRRVPLSLECLEDRVVPALLEVVPNVVANGSTAFPTLSQALAKAHSGDTIQIELGSAPGSATVSVDNLTIQGNGPLGGAGALQASGTMVASLTLAANNTTVSNLFLGGATIGAGKTGERISNSIFSGSGGGVSQTYSSGAATTTNGNNTLSGNLFLAGATVQLGNTVGSNNNTASNDTIANNLFLNSAAPAVFVANESSGLTIANNRIEYTSPSGGSAILTVVDSVGTITGNVLHANGLNFAGLAIDDVSGDARTTNLTVSNNVITSSRIGIDVRHVSTTNAFNVSLTGNSLAGSPVGLALTGNGAGGNHDYGTIDVSGNDFRGYTGTSGNFAIQATDSAKNTTAVPAQGNTFGVANPQSAVSTANAPGTTIDTSTALSGGPASLAAMFEALGGGAPTAAQHSSFDGASALQQALAAVRSTQAAKALVDGLYVSLLGRAPSAGEDQAWVNAVVGGMNEEQVIVGFLSSGEYYERVSQGSASPNGAWVQSLYVNLLGRQGSTAEVNGWVSYLNASGSAGLAVATQAFVNSVEFRGAQLRVMYGSNTASLIPTPDLLKRAAPVSAGEVSGWANSGLDLLTMTAYLLSSGEFAANG